MRLKVTRLNFGTSVGSGSAELYDPHHVSGFEQRPYLAIELGFSLHLNRPASDPDQHEVVSMPGGDHRYIRVSFIGTQPVPARPEAYWPKPVEYRNKLAVLVARMVASAELANLDADVYMESCVC